MQLTLHSFIIINYCEFVVVNYASEPFDSDFSLALELICGDG